jgi:tetratricopeptide (TPR) repeat protein
VSRLFLYLLLAGTVSAANWKDRAEYDLALEVRAEAAPQKRIALLDQWTKKYPNSEYQQARRELYLSAYQSLGDSQRMLATARDMLASHPDNLVGLYWCALLAPEASEASADLLAAAENAARQLLEQKQRPDLDFLAHRTLGWVQWQRSQYSDAEQEFQKCLELDPTGVEISAWLGTVLALQAKPGNYVPALWHLARAASYADAGALPESRRRQIGVTLDRLYISYHGDPSGLTDLRKAAAAAPFPPAGFVIESIAVVTQRKQDEELKRTDPQLAAWVQMRRQLESPEADKYFADALVGKPMPRLRGSLVRSSPPEKPDELVIAVVDLAAPEITLKLTAPFPNPAEVGTILEFEGTIESFAKSPFALTVTAAKEMISGWPSPPAKSRR